MPVILAPGAWVAWLGAENATTEALRALQGLALAVGMRAYPVWTAVNRAGVKGEGLIKPVPE